jgi:hypothetical protein
MLTRTSFWVVLAVLCVVGLGAGNVVAQDCVYRDEYGESILHTGAAAIASGMAMMDPDGSWGIPDNYDSWDVNADGVPDRVQFELLTDILCLSAANNHPTVDFDEIRATYEDNLTLYWDIVNTAMAAEAAIVAGGPDLKEAGRQIGLAVTAAGIGSVALPPEVFGGTIPDGWEGRTWQDLGSILYVTGSDINWMVSEGWIGTPYAPIWLLMNNTATAYTMAALLGFDTEFTQSLFSRPSLQTLTDMLTLYHLDWSYILGELFAYGLTATAAANAENTIDAIGMDESLMPDTSTLAITSNGVDAFDSDVLWGESTFLELYNDNGGDAAAIWETIIAQLPGLPVGGVSTLLALATACATGGVLYMKRQRK